MKHNNFPLRIILCCLILPVYSCISAQTICDNATVIELGTIESNNDTGLSTLDSYCGSFRMTGPEKVFQFTATEDAEYQFELIDNSELLDLDAFAVNDQCNIEECLGSTDEALPTDPDIMVVPLTAGQTIYIIVDGEEEAISPFTLSVMILAICNINFEIEYLDCGEINLISNWQHRDPAIQATYNWTVSQGPNIQTSTLTNPSFNLLPGIATIDVTATGTDGCVSTNNKTIQIEYDERECICKDVVVSYIPDADSKACCFTIEVENNSDFIFSGIRMTSVAPVQITYLTVLNGWSLSSYNAIDMATVEHPTRSFGKGVTEIARICTYDTVNNNTDVVKFEWLDAQDVSVCEQIIEVDCSDKEDKNNCLELKEERIICEEKLWCFKVRNISNRPITIGDIELRNISPSNALNPDIINVSPLQPQARSAEICISYSGNPGDIISYNIIGIKDGSDDHECCTDALEHTITIPECPKDSCCRDEDRFNEIVNNGFEISVMDNCEVMISFDNVDSCLWLSQADPDWGDGSIIPQVISPLLQTYTHKYDSSGTYNICAVVYELDSNGEVCFQEEICKEVTVECECTEIDNCIEITNVEAKNIKCDVDPCYVNPMCQKWLLDKITGLQCDGIPNARVEKGYYNNMPIVIISQSFLDSGDTEIYSCEGDLIQRCSFGVPPPPVPCSPDAGINIGTDISFRHTIWDCNNQMIDSTTLCEIEGSATCIEYCFTVLNTSNPSIAIDKINLITVSTVNGIFSPAMHLINPIVNGESVTINTLVCGEFRPGDNLGIEISTESENEDYCCESAEIIELTVPDCQKHDCCENTEKYDDIINRGLTINYLENCEVEVLIEGDSCVWLAYQGPDWGAGDLMLPATSQLVNRYTHTYSKSGTYNICFKLLVFDENGDVCWDGQICEEVTVECDKNKCEDFDEEETTVAANWLRYNTINNNISYASVPIRSRGNNDGYLAGDDRSGFTTIFNETDYTGDWLAKEEECFCFEFKYIKDWGSIANASFTIYQGTMAAPTLSATFTSFAFVDENDDWIKVCAPKRGLNQDGTMPENSDGKWSMDNVASNAQWSNLLSAVDGIFFRLDRNGNPAEQYGFDNICFEDCQQECGAVIDSRLQQTDTGAYQHCFKLRNDTHSPARTLGMIHFYDANTTNPSFVIAPVTVGPLTTTGQISTEYCVDIHPLAGSIITPINLGYSIHGIEADSSFCCYPSDTIVLPCEPCIDDWVRTSKVDTADFYYELEYRPEPLNPSECCYDICLTVDCPGVVSSFKFQTASNVFINNYYPLSNSLLSLSATPPVPNATMLELTPTTGTYFPKGNYHTQVCFDNQSGNPSSLVDIIMLGDQDILCTDELEIECEACIEDLCETDWISFEETEDCCYQISINDDCPNSLDSLVIDIFGSFGNVTNQYPSDWTDVLTGGHLTMTRLSTGSASFPGLIEICPDTSQTSFTSSVNVSYISQDEIICEEVFDQICDIPCVAVEDISVRKINGVYSIDFCAVNGRNFIADQLQISFRDPDLFSIPQLININPGIAKGGRYCTTIDVFSLVQGKPSPGSILNMEFNLHNTEQDTCCKDPVIAEIEISACDIYCQDWYIETTDASCSPYESIDKATLNGQTVYIAHLPNNPDAGGSIILTCLGDTIQSELGTIAGPILLPATPNYFNQLANISTFWSCGETAEKCVTGQGSDGSGEQGNPPNGQGIKDDNQSDLSESRSFEKKRLVVENIHIYPNPTSDNLFISIVNDGKYSLNYELYDSNGVLKMSVNTKENHHILDLSNLAGGLYFLNVHLGDGKQKFQRIVKLD